MCRIVGFWHFTYRGQYDLEKIIVLMRDSMKYGGPDDAGLYIDKKMGLALGHRRLSIIDLSPAGHQPMKFNNLVIIYNGEVYNFKDVRDELRSKGYNFNSNSDTEVVLKAFHEWGLNAVQRFRGMFAFVVWDKKNKKLILCRDRIGVKPIYWYYKDNIFMFASELKAFHLHPLFKKELNEIGLSLFLQYGYIPSPYSIFKNVYKLKPGHFLIIDENEKIKEFKYWDVEKFFTKGVEEKNKWVKKSEQELIEELETLLIESFKLRLISDVPVGIFLSGGIDSSTVCALLSKESVKLKTFTVGFHEKEYNEAKFAKKISEYLGTEHTEFYCTPKETFEIIHKLPEIYDEPFGDSSAIPTYLISKIAKSQVKVCLSADGGDEQFCGYTRYWLASDKIRRFSETPIRNFIYNLLKFINPEIASKLYSILRIIHPNFLKYTNFRDKYIKLKNVLKTADLLEQYDLSLKIFHYEDLKKLGIKSSENPLHNSILQLKKELDNYSILMLFDLKIYLPDDILVKVDRATTSVSLEGREPFLDHKLVEWTSRLPVELKCKNGESKYLLRKVLYKYIPNNLVKRPKQGFGVPVYEWFKSELKGFYTEYLNEKEIKAGGIFNSDEVNTLLNAYLQGKEINYNKLWLLFVFEQWRKKWLK